MYGYIYLVTNNINGRKYIGKHKYDKEEIDPRYGGSGTIFKQALVLYGKENFTRELLECCNTEQELNTAEKSGIAKYDAIESDVFYNIAEGGDGVASATGKHWYTDGINNILSEFCPVGYYLGRANVTGTRKNKDTIGINNGVVEYHIHCDDLSNYPGFSYGMLDRGQEGYEKVASSLKNKSADTKKKLSEAKIKFHKENPDFRNSGNGIKGQIPFNKGKISITNGISNHFINKDDTIPEGGGKGNTQKHKVKTND